jgi:hypothetical protein
MRITKTPVNDLDGCGGASGEMLLIDVDDDV